jgi:hypothetical protein
MCVNIVEKASKQKKKEKKIFPDLPMASRRQTWE